MNHTYRPASQTQGKQIPAQMKNCRWLSAPCAAFAVGASLAWTQAHAQADLLLYVANSSDNSVSVYRSNADGSLAAVATMAAIGATPRETAVRGDQAFAYVSISGSNQVKVIDTATNMVVQTMATGLTTPYGVALSPDGSRVYVANNGGNVNSVSVFSADASTGQLTALTTITVGNDPRAIRFSADGTRAYVANQDTTGAGGGSVSIINTATNSVIATVNTGGQLLDVAVNPAGTRVYAVDSGSKVYVIDTATNNVTATVTASLNNPRGVAVSADGSRFYVTNVNTQSISQFDASTNASLGTVATGNTPGWMALSPDGTSVYVAQGGTSDTVGIYSVSSGLLTGAGTIAAGNDPFSVGLCGNGNAMLASGGTFIANTAGALGCTGSSASFTGGTLRINGAGLAISTPMTLDSAGGTIDTNANNATLSGIVSGSGGLTKSGTGTLTLSGVNTYSGGTTINGGTLSVGADNNLGAAAGGLAFGGGTLQYSNGFSSSRAVTLNAGGGTIDTNGNSATLSGVIAGSGSLTKSGTGTLTLSGANTYSGGTTVNAGTLSGDTTSLQGAITNNATVVFDQTFNGTYAGAISGTGGLTKSGNGKTILSGANTYTGATTINGGILSVNGSVASSVSVNSGGTLGGSGSIGGAVTVASGGIIAPGNSPGRLTVNSLTLNPGSITRMEINGLTAGTEYDQIVVNNTATLGGTLDLVFGYNPTASSRFTLIRAGNIVPGFAAVQNSSLGAALQVSTIISSTAFDILINQGSFVPFALTHNQQSAASMLDAQFAAWGTTRLINRLDGLSAAQLPAELGSLSGEQHAQGQSMARRLGTQFNSLLLSRLDDVDGERSHGWNFWLKGLGGFGKVAGDGNAGRADNNSGGFALGADNGLSDHVVLGAAASYAHSNVDAVTANLNMDSYQLSGYGKWHRDDNYIKGTLGAGFHQTGSRRTVFEDSASANYGNTTAGTALEAGHNLALPGTATLTPYAGMQYLHLHRTGFTETGSDLANLKVREADEDSFRTLLGARLSQIVKAGWGMSIRPSLHAAWVHEHGDRVSRLAADFAAAPAAVYRVNGPQLNRSRAAVGAGLVTQFSETAQLNVAYNAELAKSDDWHTLSATFEYRW